MNGVDYPFKKCVSTINVKFVSWEVRGPESGASEKIVLGAGAQCGPKPPLRSRNQYAWAPVRWTGVSDSGVKVV